MSGSIVTRFAPSPTGFLHIGGARTALFNWLYARHRGGRMLLRIEDTDRERSTQAAIAAIIDGLKWLGLDWDGETVFQFARAARHAEAALSLVASGNAYPCYASKEELDEMREKAKREGRPTRYDGRWRDRDPADAPPGVKPVIRLKAPTEGETVVDDMVQGPVTWQNKDLDDLVLLRSDGTPTYMLAVVVDDHDMGVTDIIRGDDHLTNAARQTHIYRAFGWDVPRMAHIPLIHGPDGAKLSKRHGALGVDAYRALGYLPAALRNYLVRLGWSHGDQEVFSTKEMIEVFDLEAVGRSPARFDFAKLENLNGLYIRETADRELLKAIEDILPEIGPARGAPTVLDDAVRARFLAAMPGLKERAKTLIELIDGAYYLYAARPLALDDKAKALLTPVAIETLAKIETELEGMRDEWSTTELERTVRGFAEREKIKLGQVAQPLRAALTGRATSPGLFDVMVVLGSEECLARIRDAISQRPDDAR
ncbi:MAG: glutamate--tRNA ligase, partial [Hyphomicrobiales bacterium]|nr:glutamate--tRNA ligase [Hyphomicrobiales bacterium]